MLSHLVNQPQLINAFRLRATMAHGALHNCIGSNPTQSRAEHVAQIVDLEIRNAGPLECSPPSLPYVSNRLGGIAWTRKEKRALLSLFVFPFAKDLARSCRKSENRRKLDLRLASARTVFLPRFGQGLYPCRLSPRRSKKEQATTDARRPS